MILLTFLFVTYYGLKILLVATNKMLVNMKIGEVTTLAIPLGLGAIVIAFVLTAVYVAGEQVVRPRGRAAPRAAPEVAPLHLQL